MRLGINGGSLASLDIGSSAVRVVELKKGSQNHSELQRIGFSSLKGNDGTTIGDGQDDVVAGVVKNLVATTKLGTTEVVLGVPTSKTFTAVVDLSITDKKSEQEKIIPVQAEEHLPMPIDSVNLDWHVLGPSPVDQNKKEVLLVAVEKEYVRRRVDFATMAGLRVVAVEPDAYALPKALVRAEEEGQAHIIIEVGNVDTDIIIVSAGHPLLIRNLARGMQHVASEVASIVGEDAAQSQQQIYKFGFDATKMDGKIKAGLEQAMSLLIEELEKSIKYLQTRYNNLQFSTVVVSGMAIYIPGFEQHLQAVLQIPTIIGDPWCNITTTPAQQEQIKNMSTSFSVANGLARR